MAVALFASIALGTNVVAPGANVLVVGFGPVCVCAAKLAALAGFSTTALLYPQECASAPGLVYDSRTEEGSIPLTFMPIAGPDADGEAIEAVAASAEGVIMAIDGEKVFGEPLIDSFISPGGSLRRVAVMSRYLNGEGMGFFPSAAKAAANVDIWAGSAKAVADYRTMEALVAAKAKAVGAEYTFIRAGTLKGGASASSLDGGSGEPTLLNPAFYKLGVQDVANWRLLYDIEGLGVKLVAGDTLPGPGFTAAITATDKIGSGDSHRGAVAASLVESLRVPSAANRDFSVAAQEGSSFPTDAEWAAKFAEAAA